MLYGRFPLAICLIRGSGYMSMLHSQQVLFKLGIFCPAVGGVRVRCCFSLLEKKPQRNLTGKTSGQNVFNSMCRLPVSQGQLVVVLAQRDEQQRNLMSFANCLQHTSFGSSSKTYIKMFNNQNLCLAPPQSILRKLPLSQGS